MTRMFRRLTVSALLIAVAPAIHAQENQAVPLALPSGNRGVARVPVKLTLIFSRFQGDKKLSSVPYVVPVTANDNGTSVRMGTRVPVVNTVFGANTAATIPQSSYNYQNVGTEIDCGAVSLADGSYLFNITVTDSSVYYPDKSDSAAAAATATTGAPSFRNFSAKFTAVLRDGQSQQYVAATDAVSGQVVKIDATLNVQK